MDTVVSYTVMDSYPCPSNAFAQTLLQNMCLLTRLRPVLDCVFFHPIFFLFKMWFDVTLSSAEGTTWRWSGFEENLSILLKNLQIIYCKTWHVTCLCKHRVFNCICKTQRVVRCLQHLQNARHVRDVNTTTLTSTVYSLSSVSSSSPGSSSRVIDTMWLVVSKTKVQVDLQRVRTNDFVGQFHCVSYVWTQ